MKQVTITDYLTAAWLVALLATAAVVCAALPRPSSNGKQDYDLDYSLCVLFRNSPAACMRERTVLLEVDTDWYPTSTAFPTGRISSSSRIWGWCPLELKSSRCPAPPAQRQSPRVLAPQ